MTSDNECKPKVQLVGEDGNAFAIMGRCSRAAERAGWSAERLKAVLDEMRSGDYNNLLRAAIKHFDTE